MAGVPFAVDLSNPIADHPLNRTLDSWWLADVNPLGMTWFDLAGYRTGTLTTFTVPYTNTSGWGSGAVSGTKALAFSGSDYVTCGTTDTLIGDFTLAVRFIQTATPGVFGGLFAKRGNPGTGFAHEFGMTTSNVVQFLANNATLSWLTGVTITNGVWTTLILTRIGSAFVLYKDGVQVATLTNATAVPSTASHPNLIGRGGTDAASYFTGKISEVSTRTYGISGDEAFFLNDQMRRGNPDLLRKVQPGYVPAPYRMPPPARSQRFDTLPDLNFQSWRVPVRTPPPSPPPPVHSQRIDPLPDLNFQPWQQKVSRSTTTTQGLELAGPCYPTVGTSINGWFTTGTILWSSPGRIIAEDNFDATATMTSGGVYTRGLEGSVFSSLSVPAAAVITGVRVEMKCRMNVLLAVMFLDNIEITYDSAGVTPYLSKRPLADPITYEYSTKSAGSPTDDWGDLVKLTTAIKSGTLRIRAQFYGQSPGTGEGLFVDCMRVLVWYIMPDQPHYAPSQLSVVVNPAPDLTTTWWEAYRQPPEASWYVPEKPPTRQSSQDVRPLPDMLAEWQVYHVEPYSQWYIPDKPPTRQSSQDVRPLPDFWQEWEAYRAVYFAQWFIPPAPPTRQLSQDVRPLPEFNSQWWEAQRQLPNASWYVPQSPPTRQKSQDVRPLPVFDFVWWEQKYDWAIPVEFIPDRPATHQRSQDVRPLIDFNDVWYRQRAHWPTPIEYIPPQSPFQKQASQDVRPLPEFGYVWWEQFRRQPMPSGVFSVAVGRYGIANVIINASAAGEYRIANNITGYNVYVGENALPDIDATPTSFSLTLPVSVPITPPLVGTKTVYVIVRAQDKFGLESQNQNAYTFIIDTAGNEVLPAIAPPTDLALYEQFGMTVRVLSSYPGFLTDSHPADKWLVYAGTTPPNVNVDTPIATVDASETLVADMGPFVAGVVYFAAKLVRSSDGTASPAVTASITLTPAPGAITPVEGGFVG